MDSPVDAAWNAAYRGGPGDLGVDDPRIQTEEQDGNERFAVQVKSQRL